MQTGQTPREIASPGPAAEVEALRQAYLGLLKLGLCDLIGAATGSVEGLPGGGACTRELHAEELEVRTRGGDWPLHGLTMTGLRRLDDLQECVETLVRDGIEGDLIEAGAWRGGSSMLIRATLDSLGATDRTVWLADSFAGFPPHDPAAPPPEYAPTLEPFFSAFDFLAVEEDDVRGWFARLGLERGIRLVPGFFEETLPGLYGHPWSLIRLDGDTYAATKLALESLYPSLSVGGYLIVDDYNDIEECRAAVDQFRQAHGVIEPLEKVDRSCISWRRETEAFENPGGAPPAARRIPKARIPDNSRRRHIPTAEELTLREQVAALQAELDSVMHSRSWTITRPFRELHLWRRRR